MAETELEAEVQEILECIKKKQSFLLSGGAGSGKTFSLVSAIKSVIEDNPTSRVACMTYTNAAVREIQKRVNHKNLNVSTIHDFLWDNIKHFQKELKLALVNLANDSEEKRIKIKDAPNSIPDSYFDSCKIEYREYLKLNKGIVSHEELLILANYLFKKYPKLSDIVKDKYKFIFVDEYQDTDKLVIKIFLEHFQQGIKTNIIGFFGDAMQSIYDDGIGDLNEYIKQGTIQEIKKEQNRRNPQLVIDLANRLRTDGITQAASIDPKAPNMQNGQIKQGSILFIYSQDGDIQRLETFLSKHHQWNFSDSSKTKELNLTNNLIAEKAGFKILMDIYDKDPVIALKNEILEGQKKDPPIQIDEEQSFNQVVDQMQLTNRAKQLKKDILLEQYPELYNSLKDKPFKEVKKIYFSKDQLIDDKKQDENDENKKGSKRDNLIKHLFKIQNNINLYHTKQYNEFLREQIKNVASKIALKRKIEELANTSDKTIEEIINLAHEIGICLIDDKLNNFKNHNEYLYDRVKDVKFSEFQKLYEYLEGKTPFSTQHKTKGSEYDNVLVILDNGNWNKYNFEYLFVPPKKSSDSTDSVLERTRKIFYVCCTRAKESLAVFYYEPSEAVIKQAKEWFGNSNVVNLDSIK
jgi:DNA helicase II / ATP-dependent DNA helicase PcrA